MAKIKIGSQFSGVGAFDMALKRLNIDFENVYQAEWDKYARQTYLLNNEAPKWYVQDVYDTPIEDIPQLDIAMFSPPCQSFSLAGKRQGESSDKGILFYESHRFIQKNKPRYFIFENVKGLLSDDGGKTVQKWIDYLGGKSANGNTTIFPHEESVPYHIYYQVMNAKHYGVPQNRERIFIIGIRDDADNNFSFPKPFHLVKRLKDVLESEVDDKYFLSDKMISYLEKAPRALLFTNRYEKEFSNCILANQYKMSTDQEFFKIGAIRGRQTNPNDAEEWVQTLELNDENVSNNLTTVQKDNVVVMPYQIGQSDQTFAAKSGTLIGKEDQEAFCIRASQPNGVVVAHKLSGGKWDKMHEQSRRVYDVDGVAPPMHTCGGGGQEAKILVSENDNWIKGGLQENQPKQTNGIAPCLTSAMGMGGGHIPIHNYESIQIPEAIKKGYATAYDGDSFYLDRPHQKRGVVQKNMTSTIKTSGNDLEVFTQNRIRKLTPTEAFRLMDFNEDFKWDVSDSQAYKQAGNSIVVGVLVEIIKKLKLT